MASERIQNRKRKRRLLAAGARSLGRSVIHNLPGQDSGQSWQKTGLDWFDTLGELRGAAMKMGQIAAQYRDFLPPEVAEQLARLQRDAEPWPFEDLAPVLEAHFSDAQFEQIDDIDTQAMAAASIGQVHRGRLDDGTEVAIKIRYPGVADAVDTDIANLARLFKMARFVPARGRDIDAVMNELRERFLEETDYRKELDNVHTLRGLELPGYVLPEPVPELCNEAVLVTTLLESEPIAMAEPEIGQTVAEAICLQVFSHGIIHADPHPGNFGITADGRIALYDFGCIKHFDLSTRQAMAAVIAAGLDSDWRAMHRALERLGVVPPTSWQAHQAIYSDIYARETRVILDRLEAQPLYTFADDGMLEAIRREVTLSLKHWRHFNAAPDLVFLLRTLSGLYWILRTVDGQATIYALLEDIAAGRFEPD